LRGKLLSGGTVLLFCASDSEAKSRQTAHDGAISFGEFERRKAEIVSQPIVGSRVDTKPIIKPEENPL
jgi:hypothetical protein